MVLPYLRWGAHVLHRKGWYNLRDDLVFAHLPKCSISSSNVCCRKGIRLKSNSNGRLCHGLYSRCCLGICLWHDYSCHQTQTYHVASERRRSRRRWISSGGYSAAVTQRLAYVHGNNETASMISGTYDESFSSIEKLHCKRFS